MMKCAIVALALLSAAPSWGLSGGAKLDMKLEELETRADEVVEVTLEGKSLEQGSRLLAIRQGVTDSVRGLLSGLKGIYRKTYRFAGGGHHEEDEVEELRVRMTDGGWKAVIAVKDVARRESVTVYSYAEGEGVGGVTVVSSDPNEVTVVNIVGDVDLKSLADLGEQLGVPAMRLATRESLQKTGKPPQVEKLPPQR